MTCEKTNNAYIPEFFGRLNHNFSLDDGKWQGRPWSGRGTSRGFRTNFGKAPATIDFFTIADRYVKRLDSSQREKWWDQGNVRETQWLNDWPGRSRQVAEIINLKRHPICRAHQRRSQNLDHRLTALSSWKSLATRLSKLNWENVFGDTAFQGKATCTFPPIRRK